MQAIRYNWFTREELKDWEWIADKIVNKYDVSEDLFKLLKEDTKVYIHHCCDKEFMEQRKDWILY